MKIKVNDQTVAVAPWGTDLDQYYADNGIDPQAATVELTTDEARQVLRTTLYRNVGDLASLVGVMSDASAISLHLWSTLCKVLDTATTVTEIRDGLAAFQPDMTQYRDKLLAGTAKLPYLAKGGLSVIMPEIEAAGTAVAEVFEAQAP